MSGACGEIEMDEVKDDISEPSLISIFCSVFLRCVGGEEAGTSALAPKVGPLGLVSKCIATYGAG